MHMKEIRRGIILSFSIDYTESLTSDAFITHMMINRKPESFVPPPGYTEYYDKTTGLIHYNDTVNNLVWYTSLDDLGRLYFYTEDGSSAWQLPQVQSPSIPKVSKFIMMCRFHGKRICFLYID